MAAQSLQSPRVSPYTGSLACLAAQMVITQWLRQCDLAVNMRLRCVAYILIIQWLHQCELAVMTCFVLEGHILYPVIYLLVPACSYLCCSFRCDVQNTLLILIYSKARLIFVQQ
jgi:hypothetical protein